jgi:hypothetical protein
MPWRQLGSAAFARFVKLLTLALLMPLSSVCADEDGVTPLPTWLGRRCSRLAVLAGSISQGSAI